MKLAYPNVSTDIRLSKVYNIQAWTEAAKNLHVLIANGHTDSEAFSKVTANWSKAERDNFSQWMRYYQEGSHMKYKMAQYYIPQGSDTHDAADTQQGYPGYYLPLNKPKDINYANNKLMEDESRLMEAEKKQKEIDSMNKTRSDLAKRLYSLERLIVSDRGANILKEEVSEAIDILNKLKNTLFKYRKAGLQKSVILRYADSSMSNGLVKTASLLYSFAEETKEDPKAPKSANAPPADHNAPVPGESLSAPTVSTTLAPNTNSTSSPVAPTSATLTPPPPNPTPGQETTQAISSPTTPGAESQESNVEKFLDHLKSDDVSLSDDDGFDSFEDDDGLTITAQDMGNALQPEQPINKPIGDKPLITPPIGKPPIQPKPEAIEAPKETIEKTDGFDGLIDAAFSNIKVEDVIARLENLAKIFKNRELGRQLAIVDMMLDKLGLASFFPSLAEAMKSSLESNQYCQGRVEEILAKLRGVVGQDKNVSEIPSLLKSDESVDPSVQGIKDKLQEGDKVEEDRKRARKEKSNKEIDSTMGKPELEVTLPEEPEMIPESPAPKPPVPQPAKPVAPAMPQQRPVI